MRITPITSYGNNRSVNRNTEVCQYNYVSGSIRPEKNLNNSPNFGKYIIDNLFNWGLRKTNAANAERIKQQIKEIRKHTLDDVELLAQRQGVSRETVEMQYKNDILVGGIPPKYDGNEVGLNKVVGYSQEKLGFLKKVVVPIMQSAEAKKTGMNIYDDVKVPGGIVLYGRSGSGKYFAADALLEHIGIKAEKYNLPINTMKINGEWWKGDTRDNLDTLKNAFEIARQKGRNGEHTVILIDRMNELMTAENAKKLKTTFIEQTADPHKDGITWIGTVDDVNNIIKPLFDKERTGLFVQFDKTKSEGESLALFNHFVANTGREIKYDQKYILDYTRNSEIPCTPKKIKQIVKFADDELRMTEDYSDPKKGTYLAPLNNMQMMMGVDYVAKYNKNVVIKPNRPQKVIAPAELFVNDIDPFHENNNILKNVRT